LFVSVLRSDDNDYDYEFGGTHFFTPNVSVSLSYDYPEDEGDDVRSSYNYNIECAIQF